MGSHSQMRLWRLWGVAEDGDSVTVLFQTEDTALVKAYVDQLAKAGFAQASLDVNKFGLDYYGSSGEYSVFINDVSGNVSKLAVEL